MFIKDLLQLNNCLICDSDGSNTFNICKFCHSILPWIDKIFYKCNKCQQELLFPKQPNCNFCNIYYSYFNKIFAIFSYAQPIKKLLTELKFNKKLIYADLFGKILYDMIFNNWYKNLPLPKTIIPMPLHYKRLQNRGFNQSFEFCRKISSKISIDNLSCIRIKNTIQQNSLPRSKRSQNTIDAFIVNNLTSNHIAIIDDVITTGNTITSLCHAIQKKNPKIIIDLWCIARA